MPSLNWIGKEAVLNHHREVPYRLLKCESRLSNGDPGSGNLLIEGDNLEGLKALLPYYKGRVKCIYIDPPYNTGKEEWRYNDNVNSPQMKKWLGEVVGEETLDRHDRWLCMMWPRLVLLKEFLALEGAFFMSIDEHELGHARLLLDSIFGERNRIAEMVWEKSRKNDARFISVGHEYVLVYVRDKARLEQQDVKWREYKPGTREIQRRYERAKRVFGEDYPAIEASLGRFYKSRPATHPSKKLSRYKRVDRLGVWRDDNNAWPKPGGPTYDIPHPVTGQNCPVPPTGWRWSTYERFLEALEGGTAEFREDHTQAPQRKTYLIKQISKLTEDDEEIGVQVRGSYFYKSLQPAAKELRSLFGRAVFNNPKDAEEIARLLDLTTGPGDLVLDSFAGSGTTGAAVAGLTRSAGGSRPFILIEMDPETAREVTAERLRKLHVPFRYCTLGETLFSPEGMISGEVTRERLAHHIWFTETGEPLPHPVPDSLTIGTHKGATIALIEGALTVQQLRRLEPHDGPRVVYADACRVEPERLIEENIIFKAVPYDVRDV